MTTCIAACIQLNAQDNLAANLAAAEDGIRTAAAQGAAFITLPENALFMQAVGKGAPPHAGEAISRLCKLAEDLRVWVLLGSVQVPSQEGKSFNRSLLINDHGIIAATYDKIHLFDVTLKNGEIYAESERITAGDEAVLAQTPWGRLGMSVCYDLRFPALYRTLAQGGASIITVPAAFTHTTGSAHWHVLLRARAIETGCFIIAPAQCGVHPGNRRTYGHSLIIAPWGEVLAEDSESATGIITAELDLSKVQEARSMVPNLQHDKAFRLRKY